MYARRFVVGSGVGQFYSSDLWDRRLLNVLCVCVCVRTCKHIRWHALKLRCLLAHISFDFTRTALLFFCFVYLLWHIFRNWPYAFRLIEMNACENVLLMKTFRFVFLYLRVSNVCHGFHLPHTFKWC